MSRRLSFRRAIVIFWRCDEIVFAGRKWSYGRGRAVFRFSGRVFHVWRQFFFRRMRKKTCVFFQNIFDKRSSCISGAALAPWPFGFLIDTENAMNVWPVTRCEVTTAAITFIAFIVRCHAFGEAVCRAGYAPRPIGSRSVRPPRPPCSPSRQPPQPDGMWHRRSRRRQTRPRYWCAACRPPP